MINIVCKYCYGHNHESILLFLKLLWNWGVTFWRCQMIQMLVVLSENLLWLNVFLCHWWIFDHSSRLFLLVTVQNQKKSYFLFNSCLLFKKDCDDFSVLFEPKRASVVSEGI